MAAACVEYMAVFEHGNNECQLPKSHSAYNDGHDTYIYIYSSIRGFHNHLYKNKP